MAHYLDGADGVTDGYVKTYKNGVNMHVCQLYLNKAVTV